MAEEALDEGGDPADLALIALLDARAQNGRSDTISLGEVRFVEAQQDGPADRQPNQETIFDSEQQHGQRPRAENTLVPRGADRDTAALIGPKAKRPVQSVMAGLVTRPELAEQLDCTERTIARYEALGLPVIRRGRLRLYDVEKVNAWLRGAQQRGRRNARAS